MTGVLRSRRRNRALGYLEDGLILFEGKVLHLVRGANWSLCVIRRKK